MSAFRRFLLSSLIEGVDMAINRRRNWSSDRYPHLVISSIDKDLRTWRQRRLDARTPEEHTRASHNLDDLLDQRLKAMAERDWRSS